MKNTKIIEFDNKYGKYQLQVFSAYKTTTKDNHIRMQILKMIKIINNFR